jgi:hypothetical protein
MRITLSLVAAVLDAIAGKAVGDQCSDLAGGHAQAAFKLADPFYFLT